MRKPSILIINRVFPPEIGASGQLAEDLAKHLGAQGHKVTILTSGPAKSVNAISAYINVKRIKKVKNYKSSLGFLRVFYRFLLASLMMPKHDVVLTLTDPPLLYAVGALYKKKHKAMHIHWSHDLYPDLFEPLGVKIPSWGQRAMDFMARKSLSSCDHIVAIGTCAKKKLQDYGVKKEQITVIPNWFPNSKQKKRVTRSAAEQEKNSKIIIRDETPKFRILYAGHIGKAHDIQPIIKAAIQFNNQEFNYQSDIEFDFLCPAQDLEALRDLREQHGLDNIKLTPWQPADNVLPILESGDVHLISMRPEVQGMLLPSKFYGALAVKRPVIFIGPKNNDLAQIIDQYQMGRVVLPDDESNLLYDTISHYRYDDKAWFNAQQGAEQASSYFNQVKSLAQWTQVIENVFDKRKSVS